MSNSRNSTIEILRIISMMMVIGLHYMNKSIGGGLNTELKVNILSSHILESICITSVNIFVLISGYYMQSMKTTGLKKALNLYLIMVFYNILSFSIAVVTGLYQFSIKELLFAIVPFLDGRRWFLETYIILLLIAPFLNVLLNHLNRNSHAFLVIIQTMLFSLWPSFLPSAPILDGGYGIINFITLYFIASFIRKYIEFHNKRKVLFISLLVFVISCIVITVSRFLPYFTHRAWEYCYIFNISAAVSLFVLFLHLPKTNSHIINTIATTTFGVYILHTMLYFQQFIYHTLLHTELYYNNVYQSLHFIICIIILFVCCSLIDYFRQKLWNITVLRRLNSSKILAKESMWGKSFIG